MTTLEITLNSKFKFEETVRSIEVTEHIFNKSLISYVSPLTEKISTSKIKLSQSFKIIVNGYMFEFKTISFAGDFKKLYNTFKQSIKEDTKIF